MQLQFTQDPILLDRDASQTPRALIVDDDPVLRLAVTQFIAQLGFQTTSLENGLLAVERFGEVYGRALRGANGAAYGFILRFHDVTEREHEKQHLSSEVQRVGELAHSDQLTGLANRLLFEQRLREALYMASKQNLRLALLFIDLDGFKAVNDSCGHAAGDEVLKAVSTRLRDAVRDGDTVARLGGDEFAVLLSEIRRDASVESLAQRLLGIIAQPIPVDGEVQHVGASIGVSLYPEHGNNGKTLIERADQAMYAVKRSGKNGVRFA